MQVQRNEQFSLYFHWPFCPYRCHYCPFVALAGHEDYMERYHEALVAELIMWAKKHDKCSIGSIFYGGGTPSTYPDALLLDMSGTIEDVLCTEQLIEVTIEVNPGTVRQEQFAVWQAAGINRISIGVQSLQDGVLRSLNRLHGRQDVELLLQQAGRFFDNISVDLMIGLPGMTLDQWKTDLAIVVEWPIQHISLYCLQVHETTPLYFKVQAQSIVLPDDDEIAEQYRWSIDFLEQHGFEQYEVSNFARRGYRSIHNIGYWERRPYKGFGLAACSFDGIERTQNESSLLRYCACVEQGQEPVVFREALTAEAIRLEKIMLGLRQKSGLVKEVIVQGVSVEKQQWLNQRIDLLKENGFLQERSGRLMLTAAGFVVENEVIAELA